LDAEPPRWLGEDIFMPEVHAFSSIPTKILLPIDFSPSSQAALEMAADLAQHFHAELYLVNVIPFFPTTTFQDFVPEESFMKKAKARAARHLAKCLAVLAARGIKAVPALKPGMMWQEPSWKWLSVSMSTWL
jgi:nucleotide-binding universal stress UspA family protein